jgi:predicted CopG family antitoxin
VLEPLSFKQRKSIEDVLEPLSFKQRKSSEDVLEPLSDKQRKSFEDVLEPLSDKQRKSIDDECISCTQWKTSEDSFPTKICTSRSRRGGATKSSLYQMKILITLDIST